ncbi:MAG: GguC protein [Planctomycetota bacterium]|nr:GguC protein [Planctomycetota bacterium]
MIRLVQISIGQQRRVAAVEEPRLCLLAAVFASTYSFAAAAVAGSTSISQLIEANKTAEYLDYDAVYGGKSPWKLLPPIDHPDEPGRCLVSGTGLTHLGSARERQSMHMGASDQALTDSMRMFRWGVEGGKPLAGEIGIAPEWFYKGNGTALCAHNQPLDVPTYAEDGGEEAEIAGAYIIGADGRPYRVGMAVGNEFSDHRFEKRNYLNLAGSKMRSCSLGPELVIDPEFKSIQGQVQIRRGNEVVWNKSLSTGEAEMCHSLANLEHHHFKFEWHRRPGDVHVHFYGADSLSFGQGVELQDGDWMQISFQGFGRPLRNPLRKIAALDELIQVAALK